MAYPYKPLINPTIPNQDALETLGLGRAFVSEAALKKLPKDLRPDAEALGAAVGALEKKVNRRAQRAGKKGAGRFDGTDVDVRADQLLGSISDTASGFARHPPDVNAKRGDAARVLVPALFPDGVGVITRATYTAQYERMRALFVVIDAKKAGHRARLELLGLWETVEALRALMPAYAQIAGVVAGSGSEDPDYVRDELLALRHELANWVRRVDGSASASNRNSQLRARRLLRPLRDRVEGAAERRGKSDGESDEERQGGEKPVPEPAK